MTQKLLSRNINQGMSMKKHRLIALFSLATAIANADEKSYVEIGTGWARLSEDCPSFETCDLNSPSYRIGIGSDVTDWLGGSITYADLGKYHARTTAPVNNVSIFGNSSLSAFMLQATVFKKTGNVMVYGKLGAAYGSVKGNVTAINMTTGKTGYLSLSEHSTSPAFSIGASIEATSMISFAAQFDHLVNVGGGDNTEKVDVDMIGISARLGF